MNRSESVKSQICHRPNSSLLPPKNPFFQDVSVTTSDFSLSVLNATMPVLDMSLHILDQSYLSTTSILPRKRNIAPEDFDAAMKKLNSIAKEKPFISECLDLRPDVPVSGFLPKEVAQYFTIRLRDNEGPLNISVARSLGKVECYFSFTSMRPGPLIYDYRFRGEQFDVYGRYSTFVEQQGCLGIFALTDARIKVCLAFGKTKAFVPSVTHVKPKKRDLKDIIDADLKRYRNNPLLREKLDEDVKTILAKRRELQASFQSSDTRLSSALSMPDLQVRQALRDQRLVQTRQRKRELLEAKRTYALEQLHRRELWQSALKESQRIDRFMSRKRSFEEFWMCLISFASMTELIHTRFHLCRLNYMHNRLEFIMAYRIQMSFKIKMKEMYQTGEGQIVRARNSLLLLKAFGTLHFWPQQSQNVFSCIQESSKNAQIMRIFNEFFETILKIQRSWKRKKLSEAGYMEFLGEMWDREVVATMQKLKEKYKKKPKKSTFSKYLNIHPDVKTSIIHDYWLQKRKAFNATLIFYSAAKKTNPEARRPMFNALPKGNELRLMIKAAIEQSHKGARTSLLFAREDTHISAEP